MKTLTFKELAIVDPYSQDPEFLTAVSNDQELQNIVNEAKKNDNQLAVFMKDIPMPSEKHMSAINNIVNQSRDNVTAITKSPFTKTKPFMAIAASLFVMTASFLMVNQHDEHTYNSDLALNALAHTNHAMELVNMGDSRPSLTSVNNRLATLGAKLSDAKNILWSKDCEFEGVDSTHLIYDNNDNIVNVFFVPKTLAFDEFKTKFENANFNGIITEHERGYLIVVAPKTTNINDIESTIDSQLDWEI